MGQKSTEWESPRNDWISPYFVLTYHHSKCADQAQEAVGSILRNASKTARHEPWTVLHNGSLSPDGNSRSYVSWAPYWWPDCCQDVGTSNTASENEPDQSGELNKRQVSREKSLKKRDQAPMQQKSIVSSDPAAGSGISLKASTQSSDNACAPEGSLSDPTLIYKNCVYIRRDGVRNTDLDLLPCRETFVEMSKAVLTNALAYGLTRDETFAQKAVTFIRTFFIDPRTGVLPNINYGQIIRGPPGAGKGGQNDWSKGTFRGLIEWRYILNIVNAIVMIRACGSKSWSTLDAAQMSKWASDYLHWLETSEIALQTRDNKNNMASFYYNQVISLYIVLGKTEQAATQANEYFTNSFMGQIDAQGNQPLESSRTRSFHYLTFGLEGMLANAKLADNLGLNMWCAKTSNGTTIQDAVDYILDLANSNLINGGADTEINDYADFAAHVATTLTAYGDRADGRYQKYLSNPQLTGDPNQVRTWRLYNLPCSFYSSPSKGHPVSSQKFN